MGVTGSAAYAEAAFLLETRNLWAISVCGGLEAAAICSRCLPCRAWGLQGVLLGEPQFVVCAADLMGRLTLAEPAMPRIDYRLRLLPITVSRNL